MTQDETHNPEDPLKGMPTWGEEWRVVRRRWRVLDEIRIVAQVLAAVGVVGLLFWLVLWFMDAP